MLSLKQLCMFTLCGGHESPSAQTPKYFHERFKGQYEAQIVESSAYSCWQPKDVALWKMVLPDDLFHDLIQFKQVFYGTYLSDFEHSFYGGERHVKRARIVFDIEETKRIYVDGVWKVLSRTFCEKTVEIDHRIDPPAWRNYCGFVSGTVSEYIVSKLTTGDKATLTLMPKDWQQDRGKARAMLEINFEK
jgi:hypothetical protein